jgi:hypothetical protein
MPRSKHRRKPGAKAVHRPGRAPQGPKARVVEAVPAPRSPAPQPVSGVLDVEIEDIAARVGGGVEGVRACFSFLEKAGLIRTIAKTATRSLIQLTLPPEATE